MGWKIKRQNHIPFQMWKEPLPEICPRRLQCMPIMFSSVDDVLLTTVKDTVSVTKLIFISHLKWPSNELSHFLAGDDQVDVKYYKKRHVPLPPTSTSSSISSANAFDFLCKNPDCWQMNDTVPRNSEDILSEWSPSDRSLFTCFIDSFPSNYCFVAYMMRNKSCAQVKKGGSIIYDNFKINRYTKKQKMVVM